MMIISMAIIPMKMNTNIDLEVTMARKKGKSRSEKNRRIIKEKSSVRKTATR
jgi:hypothetical protein